MIIIIDGYNVLKQIFPGLKQNLKKQRHIFIKQLAHYQSVKNPQISQIIAVFDAGPSTHAIRTVESGVVVIFSGTKRSADEWIIDFAERSKGKEVLVVTYDRAVVDACAKLGFDTLGSHEFYAIVQKHLIDQQEKQPTNTIATDLQKYTDADPTDDALISIDTQSLDFLMEQATHSLVTKKDDPSNPLLSRKKKSFKLSKKDRRALATLKKLT